MKKLNIRFYILCIMVKLTWLGHSAFMVEMEGKTILIDPFLNENPLAPIKANDIKKADIIVVTHEHSDHYGDCASISKKLNSKVVALFETAIKAQKEGASETIGTNIGSPFYVDNIKIVFTQAFHTGNPSGVVIFGEGIGIYHAGDTGLFGDMKIIGELYKPYAALLPIGGFFTMGPEEAGYAVKLLKPKVAIPMHYNTFPPIQQDPKKFEEEVKKRSKVTRVKILKPGETIELPL